jgi:hypothetical protein
VSKNKEKPGVINNLCTGSDLIFSRFPEMQTLLTIVENSLIKQGLII